MYDLLGHVTVFMIPSVRECRMAAIRLRNLVLNILRKAAIVTLLSCRLTAVTP